MECCDTRLCFQIFVGILIGLLVLAQGSILNYYIISDNAATSNVYFFFLGDFICIFVFAGTISISYRYYVNRYGKGSKPVSRHQSFNLSPDRFIPKYSLNRFGVLPLIYLSWALYALLLLAKIVLIFTSSIPSNLDPKNIAGPQLLKVTIAVSGIIFLLLVEAHNWEKRGSQRYQYCTSVCSRTGIEILDSVSFLSMLIAGTGEALPMKEVTDTVEIIIIVLSISNFLLPCLVLYKLSLRENATERLPLPLTVMHTLLHVCLIDIPFLVIRLYLWIRFHHNSSIFIVKNVFGIYFSIRLIYPDIVEKCLAKITKKKIHNVDEEFNTEKTIPLQEVEKEKEILDDKENEIIKINHNDSD